MFYTGVKVEA